MFPYRMIKGIVAGCLGTGAEGYALAKPQTNPLNDGWFRRGYVVRGSLAPTASAYMMGQRTGPAVDLRGTGVGFQGQLGLQALSRLSNPNG